MSIRNLVIAGGILMSVAAVIRNVNNRIARREFDAFVAAEEEAFAAAAKRRDEEFEADRQRRYAEFEKGRKAQQAKFEKAKAAHTAQTAFIASGGRFRRENI